MKVEPKRYPKMFVKECFKELSLVIIPILNNYPASSKIRMRGSLVYDLAENYERANDSDFIEYTSIDRERPFYTIVAVENTASSGQLVLEVGRYAVEHGVWSLDYPMTTTKQERTEIGGTFLLNIKFEYTTVQARQVIREKLTAEYKMRPTYSRSGRKRNEPLTMKGIVGDLVTRVARREELSPGMLSSLI